MHNAAANALSGDNLRSEVAGIAKNSRFISIRPFLLASSSGVAKATASAPHVCAGVALTSGVEGIEVKVRVREEDGYRERGQPESPEVSLPIRPKERRKASALERSERTEQVGQPSGRRCRVSNAGGRAQKSNENAQVQRCRR